MNTCFFDRIDHENKAYWLGFIFADGSVFWNPNKGNYGFSIGLQPNDSSHLVRLERDLGGTRQPELNETSTRLSWYSKQLAQTLINIGIPVRKSYCDTLEVPSIPTKYHKDFWRGMFDGDGMITFQQKKPHLLPEYKFSLAGSKSALKSFQLWGQQKANMNPQKIRRAKNQKGYSGCFVFYMSGNRQIASVLTALYKDSDLWLERKHCLYLRLIAQNSQHGYRNIKKYKNP